MTTDTNMFETLMEERKEELKSICDSFLNLKDKRYVHNIYYTLQEVFFLVLCAQICGYQSFREYQTYGKIKLDFLRRYLPYKKGIPSHTTIGRILAIILPAELEKIFVESIQSIISSKIDPIIESKNNEKEESQKNIKKEIELIEEQKDEDFKLEEIEQDVIAIDGKRHRGVRKKTDSDNALHVVSAFSSTHGLTLGQVKVADKTNEITAIPDILDVLDISGQIVTIDAIGCQTEIVQKIRSKKADYIISLKGNQGNLHEDVCNFFDDPEELKACDFFDMHNRGHGRIEHRKCYVAPIKVYECYEKWKDLNTIVRLDSSRIIKGVEQKETRYFITSLPPDPKKILRSIRMHWGIENKCHWMLDVIFQEDNRIIWNSNIAYNESIIRRLSLNLLINYQKIAEPIIRADKIAIKTLRKLIILDDKRMEGLLGCF